MTDDATGFVEIPAACVIPVGCFEANPLELYLPAACGPSSLARARLSSTLLEAPSKNTERAKQINIFYMGMVLFLPSSRKRRVIHVSRHLQS